MVLDQSGQQLLNQTKTDSIIAIIVYSFQDFLKWWYIQMPIWHFRKLARISLVTDDTLSITLLLKNFFTPWHRDYSIIGWFFGIIMKLLYLPIAIVIYLITILVYIAIILLWLALPPCTLTFIFATIFK